MGIHVKFGTYSCENNELDKSQWIQWLPNNNWVDCQLVNTDILNPILKVTNGKVNSTYVEIQEFGRFYFVESVDSIVGRHCLLHCHVDVLYTYRSGIGNLECLVARNEFDWDGDIADPMIPVKCTGTIVDKEQFGQAIFEQSDIFAYYLVKIAN